MPERDVEDIFVAYTETAPGEGVYSLLSDEDAATRFFASEKARGRKAIRIHTRSGRLGDPAILTVVSPVAVPSTPDAQHARLREVDQGAINWLMEEGVLRFRE